MTLALWTWKVWTRSSFRKRSNRGLVQTEKGIGELNWTASFILSKNFHRLNNWYIKSAFIQFEPLRNNSVTFWMFQCYFDDRYAERIELRHQWTV